MKWFNGYRIRLVLVGFVAAIVLGGGRAKADFTFGEPINLGPTVNSGSSDLCPWLSADGLEFYFVSTRPGGSGAEDLWVTTRTLISEPWGEPVNLGPPVNTEFGDDAAMISADGSMLYFTSYRFDAPMEELCRAPIIPIVDFNGDGIVDAADLCIMVDYWGTDEPLCDIGPMPWGDGIVDVQDLIVLAEHLFEEYPPVEPVE